MGYYINKNHGKYDEPLIKVQQPQQQQSGIDYVAYGMNMGLSIFGSFLTYYSDGHGGGSGVKEDEKVSKETEKQINEIQGIIDTKLKEVNVASIADLSKNITASQDAINTIQSQITDTNTKISDLKCDIGTNETSINYLEFGLTGDTEKDADIQKKIDILKNGIEEKENEIKNLENQKTELNKNLTAEQEKLVKLAEIENLQHNIDKLKKQLPEEVAYDVNKERDDLSSFRKALTNFKENPSKETADALKNAYSAGDKGVENKTAQKAYEYIQKQYPQFFNK